MTTEALQQGEFSPWPTTRETMTTEELHAMIRMLQEHSPLHQISNMEARTVFELLLQRGFKIIPPTNQLPGPTPEKTRR